MSQRILIRDAQLVDGRSTDILIFDGVVAELGIGLSDAKAVVINAAGLLALPGLVDLHTHLREPGFEHSETVLSGSQAAAIGGFTAVHAMANTSPVADTAGVVEQVQALGEDAGYVTVRPVGAVTIGLAGKQLAEIGAMAQSRAKVRMFSDDGKCVSDALLMRRALEYVKTFDGIVAQHAQEPRLTEDSQMNEGPLSSELGLEGWPSVAEEAVIARDVLLSEHVGARLHICHLSTAGSVDVIRWAKARGIRVTAEVTPHHLLLTEDLANTYDARFKVNPPLRSQDDVMALRAGVADGTIDVIATDHAPHSVEDKDSAWADAAFGMVGLESALSVVQAALIETGVIGWPDVARIFSRLPAEIASVPGYERGIATGARAELVLVDPAAHRNFARTDLRGRSINSPFLGMTLPGRVIATIHNGYQTVLEGELVSAEHVAGHASKSRGRSRG